MATKNPPAPPSEADVREFTNWATSPGAWFAHAEQLYRSSDVLWAPLARLFDLDSKAHADPDAGLHGPAYLLVAGFSIEAMLKAAAIQTELNAGGINRVIVPGPSPTLQSWVKTHNLERLAARAAIACPDETLIYLRRFERYIRWAGRYPVSIAPRGAAEPRGFDYQVGVQDRQKHAQIYDLAKAAYLNARDADNAWAESSHVGDYRRREAAWMAMCTRWLRVVRPALVDHAQRVANGDRGALQVNVDTDDMQSQLSARTALVRLEPVWLPADEFIAIVRADEGVGDDTGRRWAAQLATMDPTQDVALFVHSTPDAEGRWFSRYIFLKGGHVVDDPGEANRKAP